MDFKQCMCKMAQCAGFYVGWIIRNGKKCQNFSLV